MWKLSDAYIKDIAILIKEKYFDTEFAKLNHRIKQNPWAL